MWRRTVTATAASYELQARRTEEPTVGSELGVLGGASAFS